MNEARLAELEKILEDVGDGPEFVNARVAIRSLHRDKWHWVDQAIHATRKLGDVTTKLTAAQRAYYHETKEYPPERWEVANDAA